MTDAKQNGRSGILALGGFVLGVHLLSDVLYNFAQTPAFIFKYGALTAMQLHLWTATISLPSVFLIAMRERQLGRKLLGFAVKITLSVWLFFMLYAFFFIPWGKVEWNPSASRFEFITTEQR